MFGIGARELIGILVIALVIFGPGKLPEIRSALGKGIRDFTSASLGFVLHAPSGEGGQP